MVRKLSIVAFAGIMCLASAKVQAQKSEVPVKEFAVRFIPLNYVDFVFKSEKKVDRIRRFRLMASSIAFATGQKNTSLLANIGFAYGIEKRKDLGVNTYFQHGWEPFMMINLNQGNKYMMSQITLGVGYVLGFTHNFSDKFAMGFEMIPTLSTNRSISSTPSAPQPFKLNSSFSASSVAFSFVYRIR